MKKYRPRHPDQLNQISDKDWKRAQDKDDRFNPIIHDEAYRIKYEKRMNKKRKQWAESRKKHNQ